MRIATANPLAEQFFGQGARLLARHALADVMTFEDTRMPDRIAAAEAPLSVREAAVVVRGLGPRSIEITTAPVADYPGWQLMTIQDNAAFEALGEDTGGSENLFLRGPEILAHEIRNPLAGIRGAAQLLARKLDARDIPLTELITAEVDRVAGLIERMQMLSGRTVPQAVPCNLHEIVRRAIAVIEAGSLQGQPDVVIREEFDPSLPPVLGEPDGLVQVLLNLLANACEACAGMRDARIWVRTRFSSGLQLQVGEDRAPVRLPIEIR
ncbi:MAG: PAS domain-containing sensor histidine kinase, partial [Alphaproteobacteria bacterium]|nr:PAS domain-containing sensor histidine kinase [Alphaproteobacteria bacterium]